jgi:hypothetical protein
MAKCEHRDGWHLIESDVVVINTEYYNEDFEAEFGCNHLGCNERKIFKFDIKNIEEIKKRR